MPRPIVPPISASRLRERSTLLVGGASEATRTAELAAWPTSSGPPPSASAAAMASATNSAICHVPWPIAAVSRSPTSTPTETPTTISIVRRPRAPSVTPSEIVAAIGAKNGRWWPTMSCATTHASAAPSDVCAIGSALAISRAPRARSDARDRRAASSMSSSPRAARVVADSRAGRLVDVNLPARRKSPEARALRSTMLRFLARGAAGALLAAALPSTAAAASPTILPAVTRTLSATAAVPRTCDHAPQTGRGLATTTYSAPMSGYLTPRLRAASGDWDLLLRDGASGRRVAASQGFRSSEVAGAWVRAGDRLVAEGCRRAWRSARATVSLTLADVAAPKAGTAPELVRVYGDPRKVERLDQLAGFDVTEDRRAKWVDVIVDGPAQLDTLRRLGLRYDVRIADLQDAYSAARRSDARYAA